MKVKFVPQNVEHEINPGQSVMALAHEKGITIRSTCNGMPSCAECRVRVVEGEFNINPPSRKELSLIGTGYYIDQRRLSCQVQCFGDITIDTNEQIEKASEGPITKKFLSRVHKTSAQDTHSVGGILIEQDEALLKQLEQSIPQAQVQREQHAGGGEGGGDRSRGGDKGEPGARRHRNRNRNRNRHR